MTLLTFQIFKLHKPFYLYGNLKNNIFHNFINRIINIGSSDQTRFNDTNLSIRQLIRLHRSSSKSWHTIIDTSELYSSDSRAFLGYTWMRHFRSLGSVLKIPDPLLRLHFVSCESRFGLWARSSLVAFSSQLLFLLFVFVCVGCMSADGRAFAGVETDFSMAGVDDVAIRPMIDVLIC